MSEIGTALAPAKINLSLRIVGRRHDGYHLLSMLNAEIDLSDRISLTELPNSASAVGQQPDQSSIKCSPLVRTRLADTEIGALESSPKNSVLAAIAAFRGRFKNVPPVHATVEKEIVSGGGLGGGSSDAAATLRLLANRYAKSAPDLTAQMAELAATIGADVPYFLTGGLAWVSGIGEIVRPLRGNPLKSRSAMLIVPPFGCPTPKVYAAFRAITPSLSSAISQEEPPATSDWVHEGRLTDNFLGLLKNDLESAAQKIEPRLTDILSALRRIPEVHVQMTGSGSVLFALPVVDPDFRAEQISMIQSVAQSAGCDVLAHKIL